MLMIINNMSSKPIKGEPSHSKANPILSLSMPTLDIFSKHLLDPDDSSYALFPKTHDDPRNPPRHPKHRSHEGHKEEQQQWLEDIKNLCAVAIE